MFSPGDYFFINSLALPGTNFNTGVSLQSLHPNKLGTDIYAAVMRARLNGVYP